MNRDLKIAERVRSRHAAKELAQLIKTEIAEQSLHLDVVAEVLVEELGITQRKVLEEPFTDAEAASFELQRIEFGQHIGKRFKDIPGDYLTWLVDEARPLRKYVFSDYFHEHRRD